MHFVLLVKVMKTQLYILYLRAEFDINLEQKLFKAITLMIASRQIYGIPNFQPITLRSRMKLCA
jgi:hypothetical protein